jgi:replicative DNA helicase
MSIVYRPGATIPEIRSLIRRETSRLQSKFKAKKGIAAIDYIQIIDGQKEKNESRENELSKISRACMGMAGKFKMPILALSQLNRDVENRVNKRPQLADLRESGAIEQDAYAVMFMYRDEYYNSSTSDPGIVEVDVAKHRNGSTGMFKLRFDGPTMHFMEHMGGIDYDDSDMNIQDN